MDPDRIDTQLHKTLDTAFEVTEVRTEGDFDLYCPVSFINELRRENLKLLEDKIAKRFKRYADYSVEDITKTEGSQSGKNLVMYTYPTIRFFEDDIIPGADIYSFSLYDLCIQNLRTTIVSFLKEQNAQLCLMLPDFYHDRMQKVVDNTIDILKKELGDKFTAVLTSQLFDDKKKYSDKGLKKYVSAAANIYSKDSLKAATAYCDGIFMSHELSPDEIMQCSEVLEETGTALMVQEDGMIPWMQSDFCCCGQNAKDCKYCEKQSVFALNGVSSEGTKCLAVPNRADCSCTIYGPARNLWIDMDYPDCDIITNRTIIPKGERYG